MISTPAALFIGICDEILADPGTTDKGHFVGVDHHSISAFPPPLVKYAWINHYHLIAWTRVGDCKHLVAVRSNKDYVEDKQEQMALRECQG